MKGLSFIEDHFQVSAAAPLMSVAGPGGLAAHLDQVLPTPLYWGLFIETLGGG